MAPPSQTNKYHNSSNYLNIALVAEDFPGRGPFPWNSPHFYAFLRRLISSGPHFRHDDHHGDIWCKLEKEAATVVRFSRSIKTFNETLGEFFKAPTLAPSPSPENEAVAAAFIGFLLQTLNELADCCNNMDLMVTEQIRILHEDLTRVFVFLVRTSLDGVEKLLPEINDAAEQAGRLLYSLFYSMEKEYMVFDNLLQRMKLVNATIRRHCIGLISKQPPAAAESQSDVVSVSPFVLHFLLQDLDDPLLLFLSPPPLNDQIRTLCQELKMLRSSLRNVDIVGLQQVVAELVLELRKLTYMLTIGGCPSLNHTVESITDTIKLVMEELLTMNKTERDPTPTKNAMDDIADFKDESHKILEEIVGGPHSLQIVSIIGMPGLGKTYLAKKLYNYSNVVECFDRRAWCVVSQAYNRRSLLIRVLNSVSELEREKTSMMEDERLGEELYIRLKGRRYLIVLDDVWGVNAWDDLRRYFPDDNNGSKILVTSRGEDAASGNTSIHALSFLSEDQCWELLKKKVFRTQDCPPELVDVGKKIAAGCQGLPLLVVVIGAILGRMEKKASLWEEVSGNISEDVTNILELGYKHLPEHLKLCFLYFAAFPQSTEIPVRELILHWIAQDFVVNESEKSLEEIGQEYLMELIDRNLVLVAKTKFDGTVNACGIHDLLHELCFRIAENDKYLPIGEEFASSSSSNSTSRRFVFSLNVRSLVDFNPNQSFITLRSLKLVRVLQTSENSDLNGICLLPQLRYLEVENLPASIGCLVQLQVLVVRKGGSISEVLLRMPNLQHVNFQSRTKFAYSLYLLTSKNKTFQDNNIHSISFLRINHGRHIILRNFPNLRRLKCSFIASRASPQAGCFYPLIDILTKLESLHISLEGNVKLFSGVLSFPLNLKKLTLSGFELSQKEVSIIGGLPKLEILKLVKVSMEKEEWSGSEDEFQKLKYLKLDNVQIVDWNVSFEHFPKLVQLVVRKCTVLEGIPSSIGDIATLRMIQVEFCCESVAESAIRIRDEQRGIGNGQLKIIISR